MRKLLIVPLVAFLLASCATPVWTTVVTMSQIRDRGLKDWAAASAAGRSTPQIDAAVIAADKKVRDAAVVAQKALETYKANGDASGYIAALQAVRSTLGDLLTLIAPAIPASESQNLQANLAKATKL